MRDHASPEPPTADARLRALMRRYQGGEVAAFEEIYVLTLPMVRGHLAALTIDRGLAGDLIQEVYLQAHRSRHTYDPARAVRPWLAGITRHVWLMARRTYARRRRPEVAGLDEVVDLTASPELERLGTRVALAGALARLPDEAREALVLHHLQGLSFREVAGVLGISEGAARIRASRALGRLRALVAKDGDVG